MSLFHRHTYLVTGVNQLNISNYDAKREKEIVKRLYSVVHQVCEKCGDLKTTEVEGTWTLEEIRDIKMNQLKQ